MSFAIGTRVLVDFGPFMKLGTVRGTGQALFGHAVGESVIVEMDGGHEVHCLPGILWDLSAAGARPRCHFSSAIGSA